MKLTMSNQYDLEKNGTYTAPFIQGFLKKKNIATLLMHRSINK